ncbi:MAG: hypothetical protein Q9M19_08905, partial [Mariprofundaceae bacterium]|nr:hypothetical protein [Mariprofundaceae bacterium]
MLGWVRLEKEDLLSQQQSIHLWSSDVSPLAELAISGVLPGLMADFRVLDVFAVHYDAQREKKLEDLRFIAPYLQRAQALDPKFYDVYRLAGSLLVYDANMPQEAIALLTKGTWARPDVWEFPFFAGFIAHDVLKDDELAFEMMSQVATRENTPVMVITLASRFLASTSTTADAIMFLKGVLFLLPRDKQDGIRTRIKALEAGEPARVN